MKIRYYYDPMVKKDDDILYVDIFLSFGKLSKFVSRVEDTSYISLMKKVKETICFLNNLIRKK